MSGKSISLASLRSGATALVVGLDVGRKALSRLESLGILPGCEVSVLTNNQTGPLLVSVGEGKIMVERGIASKVMVV
ncbi:MAG: ferrous iron transport protein A [Desulfovibrionaceae bacterium]|jgi:ferrous iron transport protein A